MGRGAQWRAEASIEVKESYQKLLEGMVYLFQTSLEAKPKNSADNARQQALALAATCIGGMVLSRTLPNSALAKDVQKAA